MTPADNIDQLIKKLKRNASAALDKKIRDDITSALATSDRTESVHSRPKTWRIIMKSRTTKLATAAVIIVVAFLAIQLPFGGSSVTLAGVLERVEQATAYMYKMNMNMKMSGFMGPNVPAMNMDMEMTVTISSAFGMKAETITGDPNTGETTHQTTYIIPGDKIAVTLMPDKKQYMHIELGDDMFAKMKKQNRDPREMIKQMMGSEYTELGRSTIDGVQVDGFQTTDPTVIGGVGENVTLTLWVDAEKWLPVRCEIDFDMSGKMKVHSVVSEYDWDVPVTAEDFNPVIPDDFEPMGAGMQVPKMTEEGTIEGLKLFAELTGSYPKKLSVMELAQEMMGFMTNKDVLEKIKDKIGEFGGLDEDELDKLDRNEVMMKTMEVTKPLQSPGFFHMMLVQEKKEPVYYGETVGPDDVEAVLLRWKISDEKYRVIFGDLSALDVTLEELKGLEE